MISKLSQFQSSLSMVLLRLYFLTLEDPDSYNTHLNNFSISRIGAINDHCNKWDNAAFMDSSHVTNVTTIQHPCYGCIINFDSRKNKIYYIIILDVPTCICLDFLKMNLKSGNTEYIVYTSTTFSLLHCPLPLQNELSNRHLHAYTKLQL